MTPSLMRARRLAITRAWTVTIVAALLVAGATVMTLIFHPGSADHDDVASRDVAQQSPQVHTGSPHTKADTEHRSAVGAVAPAPPDDDPAELGRWIAEVVYGIDSRNQRDSYVDALQAVTSSASGTDDTSPITIAELLPEPDVWERMAEHEQWSTFDAREPVGTETVDADVAQGAFGIATSIVLVTGRQTIHYLGDDGTPQTHTVLPALQMLIGCADEFAGCRLLHVVDQQPRS
ncbi:hypothetical protein G1H11_16090 [Phytoactinopolyspora alkaliphila]|uniref:Uncharacterized protein n=1 Tax=Phytoactinopolyspora alkaliphila TaxID=1783498 RepID=A0A6N9YPT2_9ACTN|nr:hypothetical protein [Phytoactinopolyspora alkaliphila]NED96829.1 hypothetical protein [Phytoactinopolyspora alkaliphila]